MLGLSVTELRSIAKNSGIKGYNSLDEFYFRAYC